MNKHSLANFAKVAFTPIPKKLWDIKKLIILFSISYFLLTPTLQCFRDRNKIAREGENHSIKDKKQNNKTFPKQKIKSANIKEKTIEETIAEHNDNTISVRVKLFSDKILIQVVKNENNKITLNDDLKNYIIETIKELVKKIKKEDIDSNEIDFIYDHSNGEFSIQAAKIIEEHNQDYDYEGNVTLGPEFTFYNEETKSDSDAAKTKYRDLLYNRMLEQCNNPNALIAKKRVLNKTKLKRYNIEGFWFNVSIDPQVVEVQMKPLTLNEWINYEEDIQSFIFESAKDVGIEPHIGDFYMSMCNNPEKENCPFSHFCKIPFNKDNAASFGGGHLHFDFNALFRNNALLFINFLVDLQNNPYLALGAFRLLNKYAYPLALFNDYEINAFLDIVNNFHNKEQKITINNIKRKIKEKSKPHIKRKHMIRLVHDETIELRMPRAQENASQFIKLAKLFLKRIEFLERYNTPLTYLALSLPEKKYHSVSDQELEKIAAQFYRYVTDIGLEWELYKTLLHPLISEKINAGCILDPRNNSYTKTQEASSFPEDVLGYFNRS